MTTEEMWNKLSMIGLGGWLSDADVECLREEIEKIPEGGVYLEIGVAYGKSLIIACYYAKQSVGVYGIDRLDWEEREENLKQFKLEKRPIFINGESRDEALRWKLPIDLLFIDSDHTYYGVIGDLISWLPHVKHGGRVLMHDYDPTSPGVMRAVHDFVFPHPAYKDFGQKGTIYQFTKK